MSEKSLGDYNDLKTTNGSLEDFEELKASNGSLGDLKDIEASNKSTKCVKNRKTGYWEHMDSCYEMSNECLGNCKEFTMSEKSLGDYNDLMTANGSLEDFEELKASNGSLEDFEELKASNGSLGDCKHLKASNGSSGDLKDIEASNKSTKCVENRKTGYWEHMVSCYEKRNASLEKRQAALLERMRFMECSLPSLLMSAVVTMKRGPEVAKLNSGSVRIQGRTDRNSCHTSGTDKRTTHSKVK